MKKIFEVNRCDNIVFDILHDDYVKFVMKKMLKHDVYTYFHSLSVSRLSVNIALQMRLSADIVREIGVAAILHDIGKIYIPARILKKKEKLTEMEFDTIKQHPILGAAMIQECGEYSYSIIKGVRNHHLNLDGSGYGPERHRDMGLYERIIRVADSYDAMTDDRVYRKAMDNEVAIETLHENEYTIYDPDILAVFLPNGIRYKLDKTSIAIA